MLNCEKKIPLACKEGVEPATPSDILCDATVALDEEKDRSDSAEFNESELVLFGLFITPLLGEFLLKAEALAGGKKSCGCCCIVSLPENPSKGSELFKLFKK